MLGKDDIRDFILGECDICLHLYEQIPDGGMDYRPSSGQRSMLELLRYLSYCAIGGARAMAEGDWEGYKAVSERAATMTAAEFPAALARQKEEINAFFNGFTQEELQTQVATTPLGQEMPLEKALVLLPQHWMVAYRMQFFLYVKQAGNEDVWTPDCWGGVSMEKPAPAPVPEA